MTMFKIPMRFKKQVGYILLEAALALPVAAGVMTYYLAEQRDRLSEDMAKIHGQHMNIIAAGVNSYIVRNYGRLTTTPTSTIPITATGGSVSNPLAPTVQELMALGLVPNSAGLASPVYGGGFRINLTLGSRTNPDCGEGHVCGYVGTTAPVAPGGQVSSRTIGRALQEIGINGMATGLGGFGDDTLRAQNQDVTVPGIDVAVALGPGVPAQRGLMAVRVGTESCGTGSGAACDVFLRRDGTLAMEGNLNMGTRNIFNASNITASDIIASNGTTTNNLSVNGVMLTNLNMNGWNINSASNITASDITASNIIASNGTTTNNLSVNGGMLTNLNMNGRNIDSANQVNGATINATTGTFLDVYAGRNLNVQGSSIVQALQAQSISISGTSTLGESCNSNQVSKDWSGNTLVCNNGVWKKAGGTISFRDYTWSADTRSFTCPDREVVVGFDCTGACNTENMRVQCAKIIED